MRGGRFTGGQLSAPVRRLAQACRSMVQVSYHLTANVNATLP